jgi:hypothetical protein
LGRTSRTNRCVKGKCGSIEGQTKGLGYKMNVQLQSNVIVAELKNPKAFAKKSNEKIRLEMEVQRHIERLQVNKRLVEVLQEQV